MGTLLAMPRRPVHIVRCTKSKNKNKNNTLTYGFIRIWNKNRLSPVWSDFITRSGGFSQLMEDTHTHSCPKTQAKTYTERKTDQEDNKKKRRRRRYACTRKRVLYKNLFSTLLLMCIGCCLHFVLLLLLKSSHWLLSPIRWADGQVSLPSKRKTSIYFDVQHLNKSHSFWTNFLFIVWPNHECVCLWCIFAFDLTTHWRMHTIQIDKKR